MVRVLFLCLGNICRSPMAEAVFRHFIKIEGLEQDIEVDSAGIGSWHEGNPPHQGTQSILNQHSISFDGMVARQVKEQDKDDFHYIIAMDDQNIQDLKEFIPVSEGVVIKKLTDYISDKTVVHVPDPYFTGDFDYTYKLISEGCRELLEQIKQELRREG
ncbi:low molecular weight phosphotyrosine protein phosphatase [Radiobacillus kanasensis]|uniref:low molecular weight protein-tyrosine-phosphatase n=1 Tax=Radiobacillus kanasensis TaxID=2844358 RepID=UPI001E46F3B2|nr:low molecular weight protein-tyrosine-phosphatase [Radiobacillus kanasensis]UFU00009.1 low molecular weight phosphotyrosine protein phosphatase [Radiobacillus kanasensis]